MKVTMKTIIPFKRKKIETKMYPDAGERRDIETQAIKNIKHTNDRSSCLSTILLLKTKNFLSWAIQFKMFTSFGKSHSDLFPLTFIRFYIGVN